MKQSLLSAYLRYYRGRLGWVGLGGFALVLTALALWFLQVEPARLALAELQTRVAANQHAIQNLGTESTPMELTDEQHLLAFFDAFPADDQTPRALSSLFKSAAQSGLSLDTGEYTLTFVPGSRLKQYRVSLPVRGKLVQVLGFTSKVLQAVPSGALENASFKREKIDDSQVEAKLVFQFFVSAKP